MSRKSVDFIHFCEMLYSAMHEDGTPVPWMIGAAVNHIKSCERCQEHIKHCEGCRGILLRAMDDIGRIVDDTV